MKKSPKAAPVVHLCSNCARHPQEDKGLCFVCVRPYQVGLRAGRRTARKARRP